jgi:uncharacterized protein (DUF2267 family)
MPDDPDDPLDDLRERIRATQQAAERLAGEIPNGFASEREHREHTEEVQALAALLQTLRDLIPAELADQFREVVRQVLLLVRALVDWWIERMESDAPSPAATRREPPVEEIPID